MNDSDLIKIWAAKKVILCNLVSQVYDRGVISRSNSKNVFNLS